MKAIGLVVALAGLTLAGDLYAQGLSGRGIGSPARVGLLGAQVTVVTPGSGSFLGVGVADIDEERAKALKLKEERGVEITRVEEDSPAAKAGLKVGDVVLEYNSQRVEGTEQFVRMVRETPPGREARLVVSREGSTRTLTATIGQRTGRGAQVFVAPRVDTERLQRDLDRLREFRLPDLPRNLLFWQSGMLGIEAESLNSQLAEFFGVTEGVLVRSVQKDSAAEKAGLKAGDVITKIDETKVTSPREITSAIRSLGSKRTFPVTIMRNRKESTISVTLEEDRSLQQLFQGPQRIFRSIGQQIRL